MDITAAVSLSVVAVIELIKRLFDKDFRVSAYIVGAGIVGSFVGHQFGATYLTGALMGLAGSGLITAGSIITSKVSTPTV